MKPADRDVLALGELDAERLLDLVDVGLAVDEPPVIADLDDRRAPRPRRTRRTEVAHELLEDVAHRDDARRRRRARRARARRSGAARASRRGSPGGPCVSGSMSGAADLAGDLVPRRAATTPMARLRGVEPEEVVDEEHAVDVVEVAAHDGEAGVAGVAHRLGDRLGGDGHREVATSTRGVMTSRSSSSAQLIDALVDGARPRASRGATSRRPVTRARSRRQARRRGLRSLTGARSRPRARSPGAASRPRTPRRAAGRAPRCAGAPGRGA